MFPSIDSPYKISSTIQIAHGVTLRVEPGTEIYGLGSIQSYGAFIVAGSANQPVLLRNLYLTNNGTNLENSSIEINHALIQGGMISPAGNSGYGYMILRDSRLEDVFGQLYPIPPGQTSSGGLDYMYLWYPTENCYIERNIFDNSFSISTGTSASDAEIFIRNNVFANTRREYVINNWASYGGNAVYVEENSFLDTAERLSSNSNILTIGPNSSSMSALNNYWGGLSNDQIPNLIHDKNDSLSAAGYIDYLPTLTEPAAATPSYSARD